MKFIDLETQYKNYKYEIDSAIQGVLNSAHFILGEDVPLLEKELASYAGTKEALGVSSGTDALLIALMAYGIGPGDEVITTPFTWIATTEVIKRLGAKPVLVDLEESTGNIDPSLLETLITPRTKAIMPVCLFGQMADFEAINKIAKKYGIPVIEDGAQSFGATQHGRKSCSVTEIGCTSFFPSKPLGCYGDGGAIFSNDAALMQKMRAIRVHGALIRHDHFCLGINGRLDTIQAAILRVKLRYLDEEIACRRRAGEFYNEGLKECCIVPVTQPGNTHVYAQYTIRVADREALKKELESRGIPSAVYYPKCVHQQPVFADLGYKEGGLPVAEKLAKEVLSLPMHPWLTEEMQVTIIEAIQQALLQKV